MEPIKLTVSVSDHDNVTALLTVAAKTERAGITLILAHGAGANQMHPFMRLFANGLAGRGLDVMTFNFVYMEQGRHVPDPKAKLEACYRAVIEAAQKHKKLKGNRLAIGGKSMGGRIASQVAAEAAELTGPTRRDDATQPSKKVSPGAGRGNLKGCGAPDIAGLVFLGYPLHPPGNPEKLRDAHLHQVKAPMLFVQGSRDAFGSTDEIRATIKRHHLSATLHPIEGGDHSLKVPKSLGPQQQVYESTMDEIARWLRSRQTIGILTVV